MLFSPGTQDAVIPLDETESLFGGLMLKKYKAHLLTLTIGLGLAGLLGVLGVDAAHVSTKYSVKEFFPQKHPALLNDEATEKTFDLADSPAFVLDLTLKPEEHGHWLNADRVAKLDDLTHRLAGLDGVKQVRSLANLEMALETENSLQIGPLLKSLPPHRWASFVKHEALIKSRLISNDLRSVIILIDPLDMPPDKLLQLEKSISMQAESDEWTAAVAGVPAVQARLADKLGKELVQFLGLSLAIFCLMFLVFYRNWAPVAFAVAGLVVTNVTGIGWLSVFHVPFTVLLSTLPVIVSITFVSITVHTLHLWSDRCKTLQGSELTTTFNESLLALRELALPNLLGSLTTSIGFVTLALAQVPAIRTYALVVSGVVLWTWFVTQLMLIGFLYLLNPVAREWNHTRAWWMLQLNRWSISIIAVGVGISVVFAATVTKMNFSGRLFDDLPSREAIRAATEEIDLHFGGTVNLDVALQSAAADAWKDPERLGRLAQALVKVRKLENVGSAVAVTDFLGRSIPATPAAVAEVYFLYSMNAENPLRQFVSNDFKEVRVAIRLRDLPSDKIEEVRNQIRPILNSVDSGLTLRETGLAVNSHTINREVAKELVFGFWQSLVLIGLLLVLIFRSVRWALVACLPNLIPPAVLIGTLSLLHTPVKPGVALIFSIALGLAFNNTVYLLSRLRRVQIKMKMMTLPIRRALLEEGNPCFAESLVMFIGFLIYLTSDFSLNRTFGAYMVLSIATGALADLAFLPALLRRFSSFLWRSKKDVVD